MSGGVIRFSVHRGVLFLLRATYWQLIWIMWIIRLKGLECTNPLSGLQSWEMAAQIDPVWFGLVGLRMCLRNGLCF